MIRLFLPVWLAFLLVAYSQAKLVLPADDPEIEDDGVRVSVLGYHDFSESLPETEMRIRTSKFRKQLEILTQLGISVISLDDFQAWKRGEKSIPEKCALLTFDDGWRSVYTDAFPILKEMNLPFVLYLYQNYVDGGGKALTSAMIREMMDHGATLGSHSVSHPLPSMVRKKREMGEVVFAAYLDDELGGSKAFLETKFSQPVTTYAYPGGFFTDEMLGVAPDLGYTHMFTVEPGKVRRASHNLALPRYMILGSHDRIFEIATRFRDASDGVVAPEGAVVAMLDDLPLPVEPEPGAIVTSRLPEIAVDFAGVDDLDHAALQMHVAGFGEVPAVWDADAQRFSWVPNRRLRHPICQVEVAWKRSDADAKEKPLRWSFLLDRDALYLGESE